MNYYPFHIGDYASATRHLSWEEDCAYRRLLDVYYTTEKALPLDVKGACRLVLATTEQQREAVQTVLAEFFERTEAGWVNRRADAEIAAMQVKQQKQRDKANKRWHMQAATPGIATGMPRHTGSDAAASKTDADAMPPTPTPTPTPKKGSSEPSPGSEPVSGFAIALVDGTDYEVPARLLREWVAAFPAVDVEQELREMRAWALANKPKRKTRRGVESFIVRWLQKAQDTPSRRQSGGADDWTRQAA